LPDFAGMTAAGPQRIAAVRRFNRFYTRQIGVLRKTYLDSAYSLGEMRVLYEWPKTKGGGDMAAHRSRLGYLSRYCAISKTRPDRRKTSAATPARATSS
jgi:hypothetical protein